MKSNNELLNIIVVQARNFFGEKYSFSKNEETNCFEFEVYTDYRDTLETSTIIEAFESHSTIEGAKNHLTDYLCESYMDAFWEYEYELAKEVVEYIKNKVDVSLVEQMDELNMLDASFIREVLIDYDIISVGIDFEEIFSRSVLDVVISLENDVSINHEFGLNDFNGNLEEWIQTTQDMLESGEIKEEDISLITLLKSQGHTFEGFKKEVELYYDNADYAIQNEFISSLVYECSETTSPCNALVFTKKVNLCEYLNGTVKIETIAKGSVCGYVDFVYGGGSLLGVHLEKDIDLTKIKHEVFVDCKRYGYSIKDIYGEFFLS